MCVFECLCVRARTPACVRARVRACACVRLDFGRRQDLHPRIHMTMSDYNIITQASRAAAKNPLY